MDCHFLNSEIAYLVFYSVISDAKTPYSPLLIMPNSYSYYCYYIIVLLLTLKLSVRYVSILRHMDTEGY
jgi:hypothetical protein